MYMSSRSKFSFLAFLKRFHFLGPTSGAERKAGFIPAPAPGGLFRTERQLVAVLCEIPLQQNYHHPDPSREKPNACTVIFPRPHHHVHFRYLERQPLPNNLMFAFHQHTQPMFI